MKGNIVTFFFEGLIQVTAQLFVPLTTIEEVIKQHQNGMTGHEIKRSVKTSISVSSSCPPNVVLPHFPPILPSFPNPIYFERGINSAIAQHIRETRPFDNEILNACSMFPGFVRKVSIFPYFEFILGSEQTLKLLSSNVCPLLFFNGTHSMVRMRLQDTEFQLITAATVSPGQDGEEDTFVPVAHFITSSREAIAYKFF